MLFTRVHVGGRNCKEGQGSKVTSLSEQGVVTNREGKEHVGLWGW